MTNEPATGEGLREAAQAYIDAVHRSVEYQSVAFEAELWQTERDLRAALSQPAAPAPEAWPGTVETVGAWMREHLDIRAEAVCGDCRKAFDEHPGIDFTGRPTGLVGPLYMCIDDAAPEQSTFNLAAAPAPDEEEALRSDVRT